MVNIIEATESYEQWLAAQLTLLPSDIVLKHKQMAADLFSFMRATFYRWAQLFPSVCPDLAAAPSVLAVGDLHIENFGTWRDREGRLIWGVNDMDEAFPLAYTNDLVRLAVSTRLAIDASHLSIAFKDACDALLTGYTDGLHSLGKPYVLAEDHDWLRALVLSDLRDPVRFWRTFDSLATTTAVVSADARTVLEQSLPQAGMVYRIAHREAGLGSLGRERWVAIADWCGGKVAREAKALAPSACVWAQHLASANTIYYEAIQSQAVRAADPFSSPEGRWIVRRLAPDCSRVELASLPQTRDEAHLLRAMGHETANIHLGSRDAISAVQSDLEKRPADWLHSAASEMVKATTADWTEWSKHQAAVGA